jgi:hypothetical protein
MVAYLWENTGNEFVVEIAKAWNIQRGQQNIGAKARTLSQGIDHKEHMIGTGVMFQL